MSTELTSLHGSVLAQWTKRDTALRLAHAALLFTRDGDHLHAWLDVHEPSLAAVDVGSTLSEVAGLEHKHEELLTALAAQVGGFSLVNMGIFF